MTGFVILIDQIGIGEAFKAVLVGAEPDIEHMTSQRMPADAPVRLPTARFKPPVRAKLSFVILRFK